MIPRYASNRTKSDCGPVAVYNLARFLGAAPGSYRSMYPWLRQLCMTVGRGEGTPYTRILPACRAVLKGTRATVELKRPRGWYGVVRTLQASQFQAGIVGCWVRPPDAPPHHRGAHLCFVWIGQGSIWAANLVAGQVAPIFFQAEGTWWPTAIIPDRPERVWAPRWRAAFRP